jgi:nicotinamide mononucleotide transporter
MFDLFDINTIIFQIGGYYMSHLEFWGTLTGALAVWLCAKANVWGWPIGLFSVVLLFCIFYQIQLYPDMFLQVFFFITNAVSWWYWTHPKPEEANANKELKVSRLTIPEALFLLSVTSIVSLICGLLAVRLHILLPDLFSEPSAYPFLDSLVLCYSILGTFLMMRKKMGCWYVWIFVDILCTYIYLQKGMYLLAFEYFAFCGIAVAGLYYWFKEMRIEEERT